MVNGPPMIATAMAPMSARVSPLDAARAKASRSGNLAGMGGSSRPAPKIVPVTTNPAWRHGQAHSHHSSGAEEVTAPPAGGGMSVFDWGMDS